MAHRTQRLHARTHARARARGIMAEPRHNAPSIVATIMRRQAIHITAHAKRIFTHHQGCGAAHTQRASKSQPATLH
jgi:hypothetical protein